MNTIRVFFIGAIFLPNFESMLLSLWIYVGLDLVTEKDVPEACEYSIRSFGRILLLFGKRFCSNLANFWHGDCSRGLDLWLRSILSLLLTLLLLLFQKYNLMLVLSRCSYWCDARCDFQFFRFFEIFGCPREITGPLLPSRESFGCL